MSTEWATEVDYYYGQKSGAKRDASFIVGFDLRDGRIRRVEIRAHVKYPRELKELSSSFGINASKPGYKKKNGTPPLAYSWKPGPVHFLVINIEVPAPDWHIIHHEPDMPAHIASAFKRYRLAKGMTLDQAKIILGEPTTKQVVTDDRISYWWPTIILKNGVPTQKENSFSVGQFENGVAVSVMSASRNASMPPLSKPVYHGTGSKQ